MVGDDLEVAIPVHDGHVESECHRRNLTVDEASHGVAGPPALPVNRGGVLGVTQRRKWFHVEAVQESTPGLGGRLIGGAVLSNFASWRSWLQ